MFSQMVDALLYLHGHKILHRCVVLTAQRWVGGCGCGGGGVDAFRGWTTVPLVVQICTALYQIESSLYVHGVYAYSFCNSTYNNVLQGFEDRKCVSDEREYHQTW